MRGPGRKAKGYLFPQFLFGVCVFGTEDKLEAVSDSVP